MRRHTWLISEDIFTLAFFYYIGLHYLDALSSARETTQYAESLDEPDHPIAKDFQDWYQNLALSKAGKGDPQRLVANIKDLKYFGAPPCLRTLTEQRRYLNYGAPELPKGIRAIIRYLDTRPDHCSELLDLAYHSLLDLPLTNKLGDNIIRTDPAHFQWLQAWFGKLKADNPLLMALLTQPDLRFTTRLKVLKYLEELGQISPQQLQTVYAEVWHQAPDDWMVVEQYVDFLMDNEQFTQLREVAQDWLEQHADHPSLKPVIMQARIVRSYLKENAAEHAWQTISPIMDSYQRGALRTGADILEA